MAQMLQMKGVARVREKLQAHTREMMHRMTIGLERAGLHLQRVSQPLVPVDTGNLKNSAGTRVENPDAPQVQVVVFYIASYAVYVHENLDATHKPGKQAKFLEQPARERRGELTGIVRKALSK